MLSPTKAKMHKKASPAEKHLSASRAMRERKMLCFLMFFGGCLAKRLLELEPALQVCPPFSLPLSSLSLALVIWRPEQKHMLGTKACSQKAHRPYKGLPNLTPRFVTHVRQVAEQLPLPSVTHSASGGRSFVVILVASSFSTKIGMAQEWGKGKGKSHQFRR